MTRTDAPRIDPLPSRWSDLQPAHRSLLESFIDELLLRDPQARATQADDPAALGREAADHVIDSAAAWDEHLGGFYDVEAVRELLARGGHPISKQAVSKRRGLLALTTGSGRVVYPRFQFIGGAPVAGLAAVLDALPEALVSRWTVASWLIGRQPVLNDERPLDALARGEADRVTAAAAAWARALAA